jgi:hypothetical protein
MIKTIMKQKTQIQQTIQMLPVTSQRSDNKQRENNTQIIQSILNGFNTALAEFSGTGPTKRHIIYKQNYHKL